MNIVDQIKEPVVKELAFFEQEFRNTMRSHIPLLNKIMHYIIKKKGKQLRPLFVLLCAKQLGEINESTYRAASLIELLHTATLVHDDVVDDSQFRRGFFSVSALWKNKIAVLVGDYLLSRGLLLSIDNNDFHLLKIVSEAVREMSEGELIQIEKARRLDIDEAVYYDIIQKKTASLIASCCAVGAASVCSDIGLIAKMKLFGEYTGIAFQIKDDLFDYGSSKEIGKPTGNDIKEKKMTLPLIFALNKASSSDKRSIINIVKNNNNDPKKVKWVVDYVVANGGIKYAEEKMFEYRDKSISLLNEFEASPSRDALQLLVNYTVERNK